VELLQVDAFNAEVLEAGLRGANHVVHGENLLQVRILRGRPLVVPGRDLGGNTDRFAPLLEEPAHDLLTMPAPVCERGVDEIQPQVHGSMQRTQRLAVFGADPLSATDSQAP